MRAEGSVTRIGDTGKRSRGAAPIALQIANWKEICNPKSAIANWERKGEGGRPGKRRMGDGVPSAAGSSRTLFPLTFREAGMVLGTVVRFPRVIRAGPSWSARALAGTPINASADVFVDLLAVENPEDPDFGRHDLEYHAVVADTELPVPFQGSLEGFPMLLRG